MEDRRCEIVRDFFAADKPVAAICHGPWLLAEADVIDGRTLTSWPSVRTDLRNAGATVVDEEVHVDGRLITSRKPGDIPAFTEALIKSIERVTMRSRLAPNAEGRVGSGGDAPRHPSPSRPLREAESRFHRAHRAGRSTAW